jgi:tryptophan synthase beta subunit
MKRKSRAGELYPPGLWKVVLSKEKPKLISVYESKQEAIDAARRLARIRKGRKVIVHGKTGQILQKNDVKSSLSEATLRRAIRQIIRNR